VLCKLGADEIVNYKTKDLGAYLGDKHPGGIDLVIEHVGGSMLATALGHLAPAGKLVMVGYISEYPHNAGREAETKASLAAGVDSADLFWGGKNMKRGEQTIFGKLGFSAASRQRVYDLHEQGELTALVDTARTFKGVDDVSAAVTYMLSGQAIGKVVVEM